MGAAGVIRRLAAGALVAVLMAGSAVAQAGDDQCAPDRVDLRGDFGTTHFTVELAETPADRSRGLMYRKQMPESDGMLFVYGAPVHARFWMKNTLIPLDMIFLNDRGIVSRVHANAVPGDLSVIDGGHNVRAVLEINGGLAAKLGIKPGVELRHPAFASDAAWPCRD